MAQLPASGYISNTARTNAEQQAAFEALRDAVSQFPASAEVELTIATGAITPATRDQGAIKVETEAAAASDDLSTIVQTNVPDGALLLLRASVGGHTVVVKHAAGGAGQIKLQYDADFSLDATDKWLLIKRVGADWEEVFRSYGIDRAGARGDLGLSRTCFAAAGGTADAITATFAPALTAHTESALLMVECGAANGSTTPTLNPNGLGAKTIVTRSGAALVPGDIPGANFLGLFRYDASLDKYQLLNSAGQKETIVVAVSDESTAITTGTAKVTFRMPFAMTLTEIPRGSLSTASSSGNPAIDINEAGASIFSTTLTIDVNEKTSTTAATAAVLSDTALADDAEITIDIDTAGTGAKGLKVYLIGRRTA